MSVRFIVITTRQGKDFSAQAVGLNSDDSLGKELMRVEGQPSRAVAKARLLGRVDGGWERVTVRDQWRLE